MASSLPPPSTDSVAPTPDRFTDAMSRADGCPSCVTNYQTPHLVEIHDSGYTGHYHCASCGHVWTTSWSDA